VTETNATPALTVLQMFNQRGFQIPFDMRDEFSQQMKHTKPRFSALPTILLSV
jgi:hypothetical protein